ncbi:M23 family metallopeptidase [Streptomyces sp. NPDC051909]|uniref:M23 family metallopeptidase n=1 Tax=Streptomyces sp. NPDC051909 TaxID=3154944 RepID=UPI00343247F1
MRHPMMRLTQLLPGHALLISALMSAVLFVLALSGGTPSAAASRQPGSVAVPVAGGLITTPYRQPGAWAAGFHTGIDFAVPVGTPVSAVADGSVVSAGWQGAYGNAVIVQNTDGIYTLYAHLSSVSVSQGQAVDGGQVLGYSGSTGNSTGPHLHFEARATNDYYGHIDPLRYLLSIGVVI